MRSFASVPLICWKQSLVCMVYFRDLSKPFVANNYFLVTYLKLTAVSWNHRYFGTCTDSCLAYQTRYREKKWRIHANLSFFRQLIPLRYYTLRKGSNREKKYSNYYELCRYECQYLIPNNSHAFLNICIYWKILWTTWLQTCNCRI